MFKEIKIPIQLKKAFPAKTVQESHYSVLFLFFHFIPVCLLIKFKTWFNNFRMAFERILGEH